MSSSASAFSWSSCPLTPPRPSRPAQQGETSGYNGPAPTPPPEYRVPVNWPLIPRDANGNKLFGPGESFRLMFLTSTKRNAASGNIQDYIDFVTARAAAGHASIQTYSRRLPPRHLHRRPLKRPRTAGHFLRLPARGHQQRAGPGAGVLAERRQGGRQQPGLLRQQLGLPPGPQRERRSLTVVRRGSARLPGPAPIAPGTGNDAAGTLRGSAQGYLGATPAMSWRTSRPANNLQAIRLYAMSPVFTVDRTRARATFGVVEKDC